MNECIKRSVEVDVFISPEEMAIVFWSMGEDEQARFFNRLGYQTGFKLGAQFEAISKSDNLTTDGRFVMQLLGEFAEQLGEDDGK